MLHVQGMQSLQNRNDKINVLRQLKTDILCPQEVRLDSTVDLTDFREMWNKGTRIKSLGNSKAERAGIFFFLQWESLNPGNFSQYNL